LSDDQLLLFSSEDMHDYQRVGRQEGFLEMGCAVLQSWKQRIFEYQQQVKISPAIEQANLFDVLLATNLPQPDPNGINPFSLPQQNTEFWRWKAADQGTAALYFVIDYELPILLYVGETVRSNQRWKGVHDCKRYLLNYRQAHYQHQLTSMLGIAFWAEAPVATRPRQRLESALIDKWRSPFNKENWDFWATPFVGGKG
jgi:hypothetical protein